LLWAETSAAMQEQNGTRGPLPGIEQFKLDVCDLQICRLHANASRGETLCNPVAAGIALWVERCISTSRKECRNRNSCIAPAPYTLK
jgi:hypothetical protein